MAYQSGGGNESGFRAVGVPSISVESDTVYLAYARYEAAPGDRFEILTFTWDLQSNTKVCCGSVIPTLQPRKVGVAALPGAGNGAFLSWFLAESGEVAHEGIFYQELNASGVPISVPRKISAPSEFDATSSRRSMSVKPDASLEFMYALHPDPVVGTGTPSIHIRSFDSSGFITDDRVVGLPWNLFHATGDRFELAAGIPVVVGSGNPISTLYQREIPGPVDAFTGGISLVSFDAGSGILGFAYVEGDEVKARFRGVEPTSLPVPSVLDLTVAVSPNPFNPATQVTIRGEGVVRVEAFDARGRRVDALFEGPVESKRMLLEWRPELPSGVYLVRATTNQAVASAKVVLTK